MAVGDLGRELVAAVCLARQAGQMIIATYRTGLDVDYKGEDQPVTAVDRAADELISAGLRAAFPDDGLLTEESHDDLSRLEKERVWIVDPLDGTAEFVAATGEFTVHIALAVHGCPVLGVVYQPLEAKLFYAVQGRGAYQVHDGQTTALHVSTEFDPANMCLVASRSHYSSSIEAARKALGIRRLHQAGSVGFKIGLLVQGRCDLYLATTVSREWDLCAPHAVLLEAGGMLTNLCGEALVYNRAEAAECKGLIGSNGLVHARIVEIVAPFFEKAKG